MLDPLRRLPCHPQWLATGDYAWLKRQLSQVPDGALVLDVGCGHSWPAEFLPSTAFYVGLDFPSTACDEYESLPHVFADAHVVPLKPNSVDVMLMFDVLVHLESPQLALAQLPELLKPGGYALIQVPFLYPLHDEPRDFYRISAHGFREIASEHGLVVEELRPVGHPVETAAALAAIAIGATVLSVLRHRAWWLRVIGALLVAAATPVVSLINVGAWALAKATPSAEFMPQFYQLKLTAP